MMSLDVLREVYAFLLIILFIYLFVNADVVPQMIFKKKLNILVYNLKFVVIFLTNVWDMIRDEVQTNATLKA